MSEELRIREKLALLLMSDSDDSRRLLLFIVYKTIEKNPGITINQLASLLKSKIAISRERVDSAVSALTSEDLFNAISVWTNRPGVVHLRCKEFDEWLSTFCSKIPEACTYEAPVYVRGSHG